MYMTTFAPSLGFYRTGALRTGSNNMKSILQSIKSPNDVKRLPESSLRTLAAQIRTFLISNVSKTGGHLASNLGVVELTIALLRTFDFPNDKIVWDVGHQSYVYKMLTGRRDRFDTLRKMNGLSGFPKRSESKYDFFNTGHSSTSVSAALGMARARDLDGGREHVIAVFGDGALTGGMMYEALNDLGRSKTKLILILNDNEMSISRNVGGMARYLRRLRTQKRYFNSKEAVERVLDKMPIGGDALAGAIRSAKSQIRRAVIPTTLFDELGIEYLGPVDGHDMTALVDMLTHAKKSDKSTIIHIHTKKGKGYTPAESNPQKFHGVSQFDEKSGSSAPSATDYSAVFGNELVRLADENGRVIAITGAMPIGTGLTEFSQKYKSRFFDVGIAEQHAVTFSAGLAVSGYVPVVPLYSSFLQRAYDQTLHDVCLQNLHVVFGVDRAGIVGADGETHQGLYDIAYLSHMPNMAILSPSNFKMLRSMLTYAVNEHSGPIAIRYPRGNTESPTDSEPFVFGKAAVTGERGGALIITSGRMHKTAVSAANMLAAENIRVRIVSLRTIKPFDVQTVEEEARHAACILTLEDAAITGGIASGVAMVMARSGICKKTEFCAFPDEPIHQGTTAQIDALYGLDDVSVADKIRSMIKND